MPVTFQGGSALPAPGSAAYAQAQAGSGAGAFNPTTGALSINGAPAPALTGSQYSSALAGGTAPAPTVRPTINAADINGVKPLNISATTSPLDINKYVNSIITQPSTTPPTQVEQDRSNLESTLKSLIVQDSNRGPRFDTLQNTYQIPEMTKQLNDLNLQIAQRKNDFINQSQTAENKAIPTPFIVGEQSQIQRQSAVELGALSATAQALQGNIQLANDTIDRTLKMEFDPIENQINNTKTLLDLNYQDFTNQEKKRADMTKELLDQRQGMVDDLKTAKKDAYTAIFASQASASEKSNAAIDVSRATSPDDAYSIAAKYSAPKADTSVQDFGGNKVLIDNNTGRTIKILGPSSTGGGSVTVPNNVNLGGLNKPLQDSFNSVIIGLPATAAKTASATFTNLVNSGDLEGAKAYIVRIALSNLPADQQTQTIGRSQAISALTDINSLLEQAQKAGANTGVIKGNIQNAAQKFAGDAGNPDLAYIGSRMQQALQTYRRAMTGVAFSPAESAQYSKIFPDLTNTDKLNQTNISALLDAFDSNNRAALATYIGDTNYNKLFGKQQAVLPSQREAAAATPDLSGPIQTAVSHGYSSQEIVGQIQTTFPDLSDKIQQALSAGYSYDDIVTYLKTPASK